MNDMGKIAEKCWKELPEHFHNIELDEFVVMPNHIHGIVNILENDCSEHESTPVGARKKSILVGAIYESPLPNNILNRRRMLLPKIIGRFKQNSAKQINILCNTPGIPVWQRGYYEHIIRNDKSLERIRDYIVANPQQWWVDKENQQQKESDQFNQWLEIQGQKAIQ